MIWNEQAKLSNWINKNVGDNNWGKWVYNAKGSADPKPWPNPTSDEEMIKDIAIRADDPGFFEEMVEWFRRDAPKRLRSALRDLSYPMHMGPVSYDRLCEVVYQVGFRASEALERRMILGPSNKWVRRYFEDFPPRQSP